MSSDGFFSHFKIKSYSRLFYLIAILLGVGAGLSEVEWIIQVGHFISDTFIKIFKCISLPIIALSLIVTLSNFSSEKSVHSIWKLTLLYTFTTTVLAASVACLLYFFISPQNVSSLTNTYQSYTTENKKTYFDYVASIIPENIISPFIHHQVLGVLLIAIILGIAIRFIPQEEPRNTVKQFFIGTHSIFFVITKWIVAVIPIGMFGFILTTVHQLKSGVSYRGIGEYLLVILLANIIQGFIILPLWLKLNKISPLQCFRGMIPALSLAFFSKSSTGALPVTIASAEKNLGLSPKVTRFVLPLCTSINMNGCAAFIFITVIYLMQNHGMSVHLETMLLWILVSTIAAIGNAGVPMGCFFLSASLLASMDVPILLLGIILPFYSIIDMVETSLNVWSDSCITNVVAKKTQFI